MSSRRTHGRTDPIADGGRERALRTSPYHDRQAELDAVFYDSQGWAGTFWYEDSKRLLDRYDVPEDVVDSPAIGAEHLGTRDGVGIYDLTPLTPIEIRGPGAADFAQRLFSNDMAVPNGGTRYASMLDEDGGILGDFVVARLDDEQFLAVGVIGGPGDEQADWMVEHAPADATVINRDSAYAGLGVWGPNARTLAQSVTDTDLSNEAFPYFTTQQFQLGGVPVIAMRLSFVGELGWELWTPMEYGATLWDAVWEAGEDHGIVGMGDGALTSLSGEKGYRMWGWDIDDSNTPDEVGLEHTVDMDTEFIGKAAIEEVRRTGVDRKLACMTMADHLAVPEAGAAVHVDGDQLGAVIRSEYGFTVEEAIAFAYLPAELVEPGTDVEVETEDGRVAGTIREEPLFDPDGERMRA